MAQTTHTHEQLMERFVKWAEAQPDVGTAFVIGSQARTTRPADEWSDLDLVVTVDQPDRYLLETDWLQNIGNPWVTFTEARGDEKERRVLFEGGLDVDFALLSRKKDAASCTFAADARPIATLVSAAAKNRSPTGLARDRGIL